MLAISLTLIIAAAIAWATLAPLNLPAMPPGSDKLHHLLAFGALALPIAALRPRRLWLAIPIFAVFGGLIELIQPHVGRSMELADWLADLAGIGIGSLIGLALGAALRWRRGGTAVDA